MKILYSAISAGALAARSLSDRSCGSQGLSSHQVLMTTTGNIFLANYDGSKFDITLKADITGAPTWVQYIEPNKLFAVNENGNDVASFQCCTKESSVQLLNEFSS
ncbi:unnamed protein product [Clonostachys rosea f. rosea IK726]|uniref:Uncharacterized protein n=1 Tax=Clonostachys rosea f. rosea IK726 TaxID=1349383 RepID=A0ACA9UI09_BIOOC|nr:unnamed protein product [Clonostachys rosea f. rosea IK726]